MIRKEVQQKSYEMIKKKQSKDGGFKGQNPQKGLILCLKNANSANKCQVSLKKDTENLCT